MLTFTAAYKYTFVFRDHNIKETSITQEETGGGGEFKGQKKAIRRAREKMGWEYADRHIYLNF